MRVVKALAESGVGEINSKDKLHKISRKKSISN